MPKIKLLDKLKLSCTIDLIKVAYQEVFLFISICSANKIIANLFQNEFKCRRQHPTLSRLVLNDKQLRISIFYVYINV